jgi:hypothetical protein
VNRKTQYRLLAAAVIVAVTAIALLLLTGCDPKHGSTKPPKPASSETQFKNSCRLRGGTPVITRRNGQTQFNCVPPAGGWQ